MHNVHAHIYCTCIPKTNNIQFIYENMSVHDMHNVLPTLKFYLLYK